MSLKNILVFALVILSGCKKGDSNPFQHLSQNEKDSITTMYHDYSMGVYQPSALHRKYKDSALLVNPEHVEYRQRLSYSYKKTGEHIKAMELLNEAVAIDVENNSTKALQYRAWSLLYFYRDYSGVIKDVDLINEIDGKNKYTVCHGEPCDLLKGQALYKLGKYPEAISTFEKLLETERDMGWDPQDNFLAHFYMARSYTELKEYDQAIQVLKKLLEKENRFTEAHFQLGKIYNLLNKKEEAQIFLSTSMDLLNEGYKMGEPYIERFDEVFLYQIEEEMQKL